MKMRAPHSKVTKNFEVETAKHKTWGGALLSPTWLPGLQAHEGVGGGVDAGGWWLGDSS